MTNTGLHPSGLSKTLQTGALHGKTQTVVPLKYLLILLPSSNQMPPSCHLFTFKSIWLFAWAVLGLCTSRNAVQIDATRTPGRDWEKSCCFYFTRALWALACMYTKRLFYFLLKMYFIDLFIMPSFYWGWTETLCLDSLLHRNPEEEGNSFSVLIPREHQDGLTEFTLCLSMTRDPSPNIALNATNSASGRWKPSCTICFAHLIST